MIQGRKGTTNACAVQSGRLFARRCLTNPEKMSIIVKKHAHDISLPKQRKRNDIHDKTRKKRTTMANTPSWLRIDEENFSDLIDYLQKNASNKGSDPFYAAARELLDGKVQQLVPTLASTLNADTGVMQFRIRLMGAWLLCYPEPVGQKSTVFLSLLACISQATAQARSQALFSKALMSLSHKVGMTGLGWSDLADLNIDAMCHKIINGATFGGPIEDTLWFAGKGLLRISGERVSVMPVNMKTWELQGQKMAESMKICDDRLSVWTPNDDRLRQQDSSDVAKIRDFAKDFRQSQRKTVPTEPPLKKYHADDDMTVRVTAVRYGVIEVETADPNYERISGRIVKGDGLFFYSLEDLSKVLRADDCLEARLTEDGTFTLSAQFLRAILEEVEVGWVCPCEYVIDRASRPVWLATNGVYLYVNRPENYSLGSRAYICITNVNPNGTINGKIDEDQSGIEDEDFRDPKGRFIRDRLVAADYDAPERRERKTIGADVVKIFERVLYNYQKSLSRASDIYKALCFCQMLSELTSDEREIDFLELKASYLEQIVLFAKGRHSEMKDLSPSADIAAERSVRRCVNIVSVLKEINAEGEDSQLLSDIIQSDTDKSVVRLARILQSYKRIKDIVPEKTLSDLKQEMVRELSIDSDIQSSLDDNEEEYLGMEDKTKEFKTSFVFPPDKSQHMQPNLSKQSRNVFRGICAFLNSMIGGTLYLGVNDMGYVVGLDNDLGWINGSLDAYIRCIQDEAKKAFEQSILDFLDFEVMFEGRVVAVKVRPYTDGLVYLDGVPYKRNFGESEAMRDDEKARMIALKLSMKKADAGKFGTVEKAIAEKKAVCLKRYSSASGIRDRRVEPFRKIDGGKLVWCYDLEDRQCKQFSYSRAADIVLLNEPWAHQSEHRALGTDIFNWSGAKAMHIVLGLDNTACNILRDEYSLSEKYLTSTDGGENWTLSADVYGCEAPGRFVVGLLDHVTVCEGDELKKYVAGYIREHFAQK